MALSFRSLQNAFLRLSVFLTACTANSPISLSPETLVGIYKGVYSRGPIESFIFETNGTFKQSLIVSNRVLYTNEGHWQIKEGYVGLSNVVLGLDVWKLNGGKPKRVEFYEAHWNPRGPTIVFSDEEHYWVTKQ
jgi:hypothetical protein